MKIIISPAKKMNIDTDSMPHQALPHFLPETERLLHVLKQMDYPSLKKLWACNDTLATLNFRRIQEMNLGRRLTPALLAYEGIQYQYMAPGVFEDRHFDYVQDHLRILSGFYGLLKPFDGVVPYRLEMQAKLKVGTFKDLYTFWGNKLADALAKEDDLIVNLASKEYSKSIQPHLPESVRFLTCEFSELEDGKRIEKATLCKMARGEMVRFLAENAVENPEKIKDFSRLGYKYSETHSEKDHFVFIKGGH
jgi:hypothetical protein